MGEDEAVVRRYAEAWVAGDLPAIMAAYHDDIALHWGGVHALAGTHRGKPAALAALAEFTRRTRRGRPTIDAVLAGDGRVALCVRETLTVGGAAVEVDRMLVFRVADGRLRECTVYDAQPEIVDRAVGI